MSKLLTVNELCTSFFTKFGEVKAVDHVSFELDKGEVLAIVGESGSGKSVTSMSIMGLVAKGGKIISGEIIFEYEDLAKKSEKELSKIRGKEIAMIFQDPMTCLNPVFTIGNQMEEVLKIHQKQLSKKQRHAKMVEMLEKVGLANPLERLKQYPHELSGGMRQRIVIAIALACHPKILICDEPTTALDVTIQAQIIHLIKDLAKEYGFTTIYITHDLGVVANVADRVAVMYAGQIIEYGEVEEIFYDPRHPYTWGLLSSLPQLGEKGSELFAIHGTPPSLFEEIKGDAFAPRSDYAMRIDFEEEPPMFKVTDTHFAKTWLLDPRAPKVEKPKVIQNLHEKLLALTAKGGIYGEH